MKHLIQEFKRTTVVIKSKIIRKPSKYPTLFINFRNYQKNHAVLALNDYKF